MERTESKSAKPNQTLETDTMKIFAVISCLIMFMCKIRVSGVQICAIETKYYCPKSSKECCWTILKDGQFQANEDTTYSGKRSNKQIQIKQQANPSKLKQTISKEVS